jgi:hypothetical protein
VYRHIIDHELDFKSAYAAVEGVEPRYTNIHPHHGDEGGGKEEGGGGGGGGGARDGGGVGASTVGEDPPPVFIGCLDYIFYSQRSLIPLGVLGVESDVGGIRLRRGGSSSPLSSATSSLSSASSSSSSSSSGDRLAPLPARLPTSNPSDHVPLVAHLSFAPG